MNAKTLIIAAAALLLANLSLAGESLPLKSVNKANEIIDAAIEAHGGAEALEGLETLIQKQDFLNIATGQSRKPGPPYDRNRVSNFNAIDVANEIFVSRNQGEGGGEQIHEHHHQARGRDVDAVLGGGHLEGDIWGGEQGSDPDILPIGPVVGESSPLINTLPTIGKPKPEPVPNAGQGAWLYQLAAFFDWLGTALRFQNL